MSIEGVIEDYILSDLLHRDRTAIRHHESLIRTGVLDSLKLVQLIAFLEDRYGITVADGEMDPKNFETIASAKAFVERKLKEA